MKCRYFSALFVLYPYLTIHMRELGINVEETAIMSAVTPVVAIVMPPLAGMVADRVGNFKVTGLQISFYSPFYQKHVLRNWDVSLPRYFLSAQILLSLFSSLGGGAALLLLLVPVGRVTVQFPERVVMDLGCPGASGDLVYTMSQAHPCETKLQPKIPTRVESCG